MTPRPQFTLRALLVAMLAVGCFFGGMAWQRELGRYEATDRERKLEIEKRNLVDRLKRVLSTQLRDKRQAALQEEMDKPYVAYQSPIPNPRVVALRDGSEWVMRAPPEPKK